MGELDGRTPKEIIKEAESFVAPTTGRLEKPKETQAAREAQQQSDRAEQLRLTCLRLMDSPENYGGSSFEDAFDTLKNATSETKILLISLAIAQTRRALDRIPEKNPRARIYQQEKELKQRAYLQKELEQQEEKLDKYATKERVRGNNPENPLTPALIMQKLLKDPSKGEALLEVEKRRKEWIRQGGKKGYGDRVVETAMELGLPDKMYREEVIHNSPEAVQEMKERLGVY